MKRIWRLETTYNNNNIKKKMAKQSPNLDDELRIFLISVVDLKKGKQNKRTKHRILPASLPTPVPITHKYNTNRKNAESSQKTHSKSRDAKRGANEKLSLILLFRPNKCIQHVLWNQQLFKNEKKTRRTVIIQPLTQVRKQTRRKIILGFLPD